MARLYEILPLRLERCAEARCAPARPFEGVIPPKQHGAGQVIVWDCGLYSPDEGPVYSFEDREETQRRMRAEYENGELASCSGTSSRAAGPWWG